MQFADILRVGLGTQKSPRSVSFAGCRVSGMSCGSLTFWGHFGGVLETQKSPRGIEPAGLTLVAGTGFEPVTFRL